MSTATDEAASDRAGEPLERVPTGARIAEPPAWTLTDDAWRFLWSSRGRGLQGGRRRRSPEAGELREAGLLDAFGAPTAPAEQLLAVLAAPDATLIATRRTGGTEAAWRCWQAGGTAMIDESAAVATGGPHGVTVLPIPLAAGRLLDFLDVSPAWSFGDGAPERVENGVIDARVASPDAPAPASTGPALRSAWGAGTWTRVLVADQDRRGLLAVVTGAGWWRRTPDGDGWTLLEPLPSAAVADEVLALVVRR